MDKLLHRGKYVINDEYKVVNIQPSRGLKMLGMGKEFTKGDKLLYILTYIWIIGWTLIFIVGTIYNLLVNVSDLSWMKFWYIYLFINLVIAIIVVFWFAIGGCKDIKDMFDRLRIMERDDKDDGFVMPDRTKY